MTSTSFQRTLNSIFWDLECIFMRFKAGGLKLKLSKCSLGLPELTFLGHVISSHGIRPDPEKIQSIESFPIPINVECIQSIIGLVNHYRRFIPTLAKLASPLYALLKKGVLFIWTALQQDSFQSLKDHLCRSPILMYPQFGQPFLLQTDASRDTVAAILSQKIEGHE